MLKPKHSNKFYNLFKFYLKFILKRDFEQVLICNELDESLISQKPILMLQNHFSWWDGFFSLLISKRILSKQFHIVMLEHKLKEFSFLKKLGAIGMNKNSPKSIARTMLYIDDILKHKNNLVTIYPEGKIKNRISDIRLESGYQRILSKSKDVVPILVYIAIEYQSKRKPTVYIYAKHLDRDSLLESEQILFEELESSKSKLDLLILNESSFRKLEF